jgi:hypothetical protein
LPTEGYFPQQGKYVKNTNRRSHNDYLPIKKLENGCGCAFGNKDYKILAQVHTHPNPGDYGPSMPEDYAMYKFVSITDEQMDAWKDIDKDISLAESKDQIARFENLILSNVEGKVDR